MRMMTTGFASALLAVSLTATIAGRGHAQAAPAAPVTPPIVPADTACGRQLSAAALLEWRNLGGEQGRLGCATAPETTTSVSPQGSAARAATFGDRGMILLHTGGARAGQAYAIAGCFYRLYIQYGASSGWLGLPVADAINTPDGSRQEFEGGSMDYARAYDACEATHATETAAPAQTAVTASETLTLDVYEDPTGTERLSLAAPTAVLKALAAGYRKGATQARVMTEPRDGAIALKLFFNESAGLRESVANSLSEQEALSHGYAFDGGQGYIWAAPHPGLLTLKLFRAGATGRSWLTASSGEEAQAVAAGLVFVRVEGYADPAP
jgi:hypothetical protein